MSTDTFEAQFDNMLMARYIALYMTIMASMTAAEVVKHLSNFKRIPQLDGSMCKAGETVYEIDIDVDNWPKFDCSRACSRTVGCGGFMYTAAEGKCWGCRGIYTTTTALPPYGGTWYYASDWQEFQGTFYKVLTDGVTFAEADEYCKANEAEIARLDNADKCQFVEESLNNLITIWFGLTDEANEGTWTWTSDGSVTNFTNWFNQGGTVKPDGGAKKNCAVCANGKAFKWADRECTQKNGAFCQRPFGG